MTVGASGAAPVRPSGRPRLATRDHQADRWLYQPAKCSRTLRPCWPAVITGDKAAGRWPRRRPILSPRLVSPAPASPHLTRPHLASPQLTLPAAPVQPRYLRSLSAR